jgi:hypothetical protein
MHVHYSTGWASRQLYSIEYGNDANNYCRIIVDTYIDVFLKWYLHIFDSKIFILE